MSQPVRPVFLVCVLGINNVVISQLFSCADEWQVVELCNVITDVSQSVGVCISLSLCCVASSYILRVWFLPSQALRENWRAS